MGAFIGELVPLIAIRQDDLLFWMSKNWEEKGAWLNGPRRALGKGAVYGQNPREWVRRKRGVDKDYTDPLWSELALLSWGKWSVIRDVNKRGTYKSFQVRTV